eukprot:6570689-Pyramimonas_sp.AAC.1
MALRQLCCNRCPATEAEFNGLTTMLGRVGHVVGHAPNNIASAFRAPHSFGVLVGAGKATVAMRVAPGALAAPTPGLPAPPSFLEQE